MKNKLASILAAAALIFSVSATAQTAFVNVPVTNFLQTSPGVFKVTTNVVVGTNQIARFRNVIFTTGINNVDLVIQYPGLPAVPANWQTDDVLNTPFLGPCVVAVTTSANTANNSFAQYLVELETVNAAPLPGSAVIPAGMAATIRLDTSTNLADWQTLTNASFPAMSGNRFFRTSLVLP